MKNPIKYLAVLIIVLFFVSLSMAQDTSENTDYSYALKLYTDGWYELSQDAFDKFIRTYPQSTRVPDAKWYIANALFKRKLFDDARKEFANFAINYPKSDRAPYAWLYTADCYLALKNNDEAIKAYERLKIFYTNHSLTPQALMKAGDLSYQMGDKPHARGFYRDVINGYPKSKEYYSARLKTGKLAEADLDFETAQNEFEKVAEFADDKELNAEAFFELGKASQMIGDNEKARAYWNQVVSSYSQTGFIDDALLALGKNYQTFQEFENARTAFEKIVKISKDENMQSRAVFEIGQSYQMARDYSKALQSYEMIQKKYSNSPLRYPALAATAQCKVLAGDVKTAINLYEQILIGAKTDSTVDLSLALEPLSRLYRDQGKVQLSVDYWQKYVDQFSKNPVEDYYRLAELYFRDLQNYRLALASYQKVLELPSNNTRVDDALFGIGLCYEKLGNDLKTIQTFEDYLQKYPSGDAIREVESHLEFLKKYKSPETQSNYRKLASLLGDVIAGKSKGEVAFKLSKIYLEEFRDYDAALTQLQLASQSQDIPQQLGDEVQFQYAQILRGLSEKSFFEGDSTKGWKLLNDADIEYSKLIEKFLQSHYLDDAGAERVKIAVRKLPSTRESISKIKAYDKQFLTAFPQSRFRDYFYLQLGTIYTRESNDSAKVGITYYQKIPKEYPGSDYLPESYYQMGKTYYQLGDLTNCETWWKNYLAKAPGGDHSLEVQFRLASMAEVKSNWKTAISYYEKIGKDFYYSNYADSARIKLANAYYQFKDFSRAVQQYETLLGILARTGRTASFPASYWVAICYDSLNNHLQTKKYYRSYLGSSEPQGYRQLSYFALGKMFREEGNYDLALDHFRQAQTISADLSVSFQAKKSVADLLVLKEQYNDAITEYRSLAALTSNPAEKQFYDSRVLVCQIKAGRLVSLDKDIKDFKRKYKNTVNNIPEFEYERGLFYLRDKNFNKSEQSFLYGLKEYKGSPFIKKTLYQLGLLYVITNQNEKAKDYLNQVADRVPVDDVTVQAYITMGGMFFRSEEYEKAIPVFRKAIDLAKTDQAKLEAMRNLILTYENAKLWDSGLAITKEYVDKYPAAPDNFDKRIKIGFLYRQLGDNVRAIEYYKSLLKEANAETEPEIQFSISECYFALGQYEQAIAEYLKVPYLSKPTKMDWATASWWYAGQSYEKLDRKDEAMRMYQQIVEKPNVEPVLKKRAQERIDEIKSGKP